MSNRMGETLVYAAFALVIVALYQDEIARLLRRLPRPRVRTDIPPAIRKAFDA